MTRGLADVVVGGAVVVGVVTGVVVGGAVVDSVSRASVTGDTIEYTRFLGSP